ncbi:hypothetical protein [Streptomyces flaveus]|uniref:hypothetical protein n=1 Tax=Streptomyces flaveus TaxID=66370 RepID=UPI0033233CDB
MASARDAIASKCSAASKLTAGGQSVRVTSVMRTRIATMPTSGTAMGEGRMPECTWPRRHGGTRHFDEILGEWDADDMFTTLPDE